MFVLLALGQEKNPESQALLLAGQDAHSDLHVVPDIMNHFEQLQFTDPGHVLRLLPRDVALTVLGSGRLSNTVPCLTHRAMCRRPEVDVDVTGTPCQDYSSMGLQRGIHGPQYFILVSWIRYLLHDQPPIVVHENVQLFPYDVLNSWTGHMYSLHIIEADCASSGMYALSRRRSYAVLYHKEKTILLCSPLATYHQITQAILQMKICDNIDDLFHATREEIEAELSPLAQQRGVRIDRAVLEPTLLLTPFEQWRLEEYMKRLGAPNGCG